jgi:hypothetical protein
VDQLGHRGDDIALEPAREQQSIDQVLQNAETGRQVTKGDIKDYCRTQFQIIKEPTRRAAFMSTDRTVHDRNEHVHGCVAELVVNLDEVDISN